MKWQKVSNWTLPAGWNPTNILVSLQLCHLANFMHRAISPDLCLDVWNAYILHGKMPDRRGGNAARATEICHKYEWFWHRNRLAALTDSPTDSLFYLLTFRIMHSHLKLNATTKKIHGECIFISSTLWVVHTDNL